ncbi:MAG: methylenetetrahydrofolate reductase, partial [Thermodesulfobacteriota bacterium]
IKGRVDAVVIPDMANGVMRLSAIGGGVLMHQQGLEAVIHICPRDRNRIALQGDLLTAHVLGVQNLIVMAGEDMSYGDHIEAKTVGDLDELGLLAAIRSLQEGVDLAGIDLKGSPSFTVGCALSPWADEKGLAAEIERTRKKVEAGAQFVITPPVFDLDRFASFLDQARVLGVPVIATVFLLKSVGVARYMSTNLPGSFISEDLIQRLRRAPDRAAEGVRFAGETAAALKKMAQGVQIVTLGWEYRLPAILDAAGL